MELWYDSMQSNIQDFPFQVFLAQIAKERLLANTSSESCAHVSFHSYLVVRSVSLLLTHDFSYSDKCQETSSSSTLVTKIFIMTNFRTMILTKFS